MAAADGAFMRGRTLTNGLAASRSSQFRFTSFCGGTQQPMHTLATPRPPVSFASPCRLPASLAPQKTSSQARCDPRRSDSSMQALSGAAGPYDEGASGDEIKEDESGRASSSRSEDGSSPDTRSSSTESTESTHPSSSGESSKSLTLPLVPWGQGVIYQVMLLWVLAYFLVSQVLLPMVLTFFGRDIDTFSMREHALLHLGLDTSQLVVMVLILRTCLHAWKPRASGFFPFKFGGYWLLTAALGVIVFPFVDWVANQSLSWFPSDQAGQLSSQLWDSLSLGDWVTNGAYLAVLLVITPIWEEVIFRGFLLHSLLKHMPPPAAVLTSSLVFALCHFRLHLFLPHILLGTVFSVVFMYTRNLLPAVVLHAGWNLFVLTNLLRQVL